MIRILRSRFLFVLAAIVFVISPGIALAQVTTGTPPFGSFSRGPEIINNANLNVHLDIPLVEKAGRGGYNFTYDLSNDSSVWYPVGASGSQTWQYVNNWGWRGQTEIATGYITYSDYQTRCLVDPGPPRQYDIRTQYFNWVYHDPWGVSHPANVSVYDNATCLTEYSPGSTTVLIGDGSGDTMYIDATPYANITSASGKLIYPPLQTSSGAASAKDRNGNEITVNSSGQFFDTLSSTAAALTVSGGAPNPLDFTYTAPSGGSASYKMVYSTYTVQTAFGCSGISEYGPTSMSLVSEIDLPDINVNPYDKYTFTYESTPGHSGNVTGRIASVTLPTGGTVTYSYSGGSNGITCADGSTATLTRTVSPGGTWTYAHSESGTAWTTTVTDPQSNQTIYNFQGIYPTEQQVYSGSSTLLKTVFTCYNGAAPNCNNMALTSSISSIATYVQWPSGKESETVTDYNGYGLPTEEDDYDYGSGSPGGLLRKLLTSYASLGNGIVSAPSQITVQNGSGSTVTQSSYSYDQGTPQSTSGTPQHVSVSGSRGNVTTIQRYTSSSSYLTQTFSYYDTGNVYTATDVNGAQTTYTYGACGNSFPTSVSEPLSMTRSMTWNCTGGVETSLKDENGQSSGATTTWSYMNDPHFWRPDAITDPIGAQTTFTYSPNTTESVLSFNSGNSAVDKLITLDGLGRIHLQQTRQTPSSSYFDTVETDFDSLGRVSKTSLPFSATAGQTNSSAPGTSTSYDALGRVTQVSDSGNGSSSYTYTQNDVYVSLGPAPTGENAKRRQLEYDGLGRLTSVCEITGASGSGTCGQTNSQTGYWTKYSNDALGNLTAVTQNAQSSSTQSRSYSHDFLSRLTSETNPESGTTTYVYDTDSTCGTTSDGDLIKRVDAVGDVACTSYDALHRATSITYPSGSYASVTPSKYFVYDAATVNGVAMTNAKTRLAEAYTCVSSCSPKKTDEGFSYSARGEVTVVYESTPNSSGYFHVTQSYWANGQPDQLSNLTGLPSLTYGGTIGSAVGLDGEGRVTQVTASSGQNPVTATSYNNASLPTQVNLGSGDNDAFTYDSNTLRMTQFKFNVGTQSKSLTGVLTWNANATLQQLAITDQFNAANTQTCKYGDPSASPPVAGYDDLGRLVNANCGSAAAQTFSYDPFGNINKSGSPFSFQPSYSSSTNQMTNISGFTPTYDSNGNVTNDSNHTYAWDADGNPVTLDTVSLTFDAFDRMVEQNRSSSYTQIVYAPSGAKLALMNGQSLVKAFIPLPGQATAVYTSSGLDHYQHSDWLGSMRLTSSPSQTYMGSIAYAPFGETYASNGTPDSSFTGQNPDTISTDYDFLMREYSTEGRWPSPDRAGLAAVNPAKPQSWNRYAYVFNNPMSFTDALGLCGDFFSDTIHAECDGGQGGSGGAGGGGGGGGGSDGGVVIWGNDEFDAIAGAPGTSLSYDIYGNLHWGFSLSQWRDYEVSLTQIQVTWNSKTTDPAEQQKRLAAQQLGIAACPSQEAADLQSCIQQVYDTLAFAVGNDPNRSLIGGNYNFDYTGVQLNGHGINPTTLGCTFSRCGSIDSLDFSHGNGTFHVDTANPLSMLGVGGVIHLIFDLWGGHTWWQGGIPRPWWGH